MWQNFIYMLMRLMIISEMFNMIKDFLLEWRLLSPIRDRLNKLYETALELKNYVMG